MSPSKAHQKAKSTASPTTATMDYTRKLKIIRQQQGLNSIMENPSAAALEYQNLSIQFTSQFPPLNKTINSTISRSPSNLRGSSKNMSTIVRDIRLPEWKIISDKEIENQILIQKNNNLLSYELLSKNEIIFIDGRIYCILNNNNNNDFSTTARIEIDTNTFAEFIMLKTTEGIIPSRKSNMRTINYTRHLCDAKDTGSGWLSVFGLTGYSYSPTLEDYIFLIELILDTMKTLNMKLTFDLVKWLLSQALEPRNRPATSQKNNKNIDGDLFSGIADSSSLLEQNLFESKGINTLAHYAAAFCGKMKKNNNEIETTSSNNDNLITNQKDSLHDNNNDADLDNFICERQQLEFSNNLKKEAEKIKPTSTPPPPPPSQSTITQVTNTNGIAYKDHLFPLRSLELHGMAHGLNFTNFKSTQSLQEFKAQHNIKSTTTALLFDQIDEGSSTRCSSSAAGEKSSATRMFRIHGRTTDSSSSSIIDTTTTTVVVAPAIINIPPTIITLYKTKMGPLITDEVFIFMINHFERLTGTKNELIPLERALEESRVQLGPLAPTARIVRAVYDYWKHRRSVLEKSLLREFWPVPVAADSSPFAVFRARTREKMVLRRPRRSVAESISRLDKLQKEFIITECLFSAARIRDWLKLALCDLDGILFEQLYKESIDNNYHHPLWPSVKTIIKNQIQLIINSNKSSSSSSSDNDIIDNINNDSADILENKNTTIDDNINLNNYNIKLNLNGFGEDITNLGASSTRASKRRRTSPPNVQSSDVSPTSFFPSISQSQKSRVSAKFLYHLGNGEEKKYEIDDTSSSINTLETQTKKNNSFSSSKSELSSSSSSSSSNVFVSSVPLEPIYLQLQQQNCSLDELQSKLFEVGVSKSSTPVAYIDSKSQNINSPLSPPLTYLNNFVPMPPPTVEEFLASEFSCTGLLSSSSNNNNYHFLSDVASSESPSHISSGEIIQQSTQQPVYRQSLDALPPSLKHPSNLRLVVPFGPPPPSKLKSRQSLNSKCSSSAFISPPNQNFQNTSLRSMISPHMKNQFASKSEYNNSECWSSYRASFRAGRGRRRMWVDRMRYVVPTANSLYSSPVIINTALTQRLSENESNNFSEPSSSVFVDPFFSSYLGSQARRLRNALTPQKRFELDTSLHTPTERVVALDLRMAIDSYNALNKSSTNEEKSNKNSDSKNSSSSLITLQCVDDDSKLIHSQSACSTPNSKFNRNWDTTSEGLPIGILYNGQLIRTASRTDLVGNDFRGYQYGGYYPERLECSLTGSRISDLEPSFSQPLGFDSLNNTGGNGLFSLPRHANKRLKILNDRRNNIGGLHIN